ncbi:4'-phosphopantetheinyl transferase family protein [Francisella frigiditurris]|uniref:4'-phosphopantetheinyl transferase superfamily protein n=1 Tax=Francisella frigiditurris TaxID=1542390 RepID=A0A1J0KT15_9GAMM|nr:4'-phosphopantetheinyl transferase superfamily protein [Francisella frigiditurris]APC96920.1 4'-phosphopantetheinyl transferase superfamily protein [Francisella frigiditurris]
MEIIELYFYHLPSVDIEEVKNYFILNKVFNSNKIENFSRTKLCSLWFRYDSLSSKLSLSPKNLEFDIETSQRPTLKNANLDFNISHSGDWLVGAISSSRVGVDIEKINSNRDVKSIAKNFYSLEENSLLENDSNSYIENFYKLWTIKEASAKYFGVSILEYLSKGNQTPEKLNLLQYKFQDEYFITISTSLEKEVKLINLNKEIKLDIKRVN